MLWAFAMTTTIYVTVGICWALCLRVKKSVSVVLPLAFLGFGELKVLFGDVIACELMCCWLKCFSYCTQYSGRTTTILLILSGGLLGGV